MSPFLPSSFENRYCWPVNIWLYSEGESLRWMIAIRSLTSVATISRLGVILKINSAVVGLEDAEPYQVNEDNARSK